MACRSPSCHGAGCRRFGVCRRCRCGEASRPTRSRRPPRTSASSAACLLMILVRYVPEIGVRTRDGFGFRRFHVLPMALHMARQERVVFVLLKTRQQSLQGRLDIADRSDRDGMAPADMRRIRVDLDDRRLVRIELGPGEICSEQQQHVAVENGMIAGGAADDAGHADIVGIVVLDEVLAARRVRHRRLQSRGGGDHLVMRAFAAGASVDRDRFALIENGRDRVEVRRRWGE